MGSGWLRIDNWEGRRGREEEQKKEEKKSIV